MSEDISLPFDPNTSYGRKKTAQLKRCEIRIDKKLGEAASLDKRNQAIADCMNGTPILVGHHSEKRHRRELERMDNRSRKSYELKTEAKRLEKKIDNILHPRAISADDPEAVVKLKEKRQRALDEILEWQKVPIKPRDFTFSKEDQRAFQIAGLRAEIRRIDKRIDSLAQVEKLEDVDKEINGVNMVTDKVDNRIRLVFPGKPSPEIITELKRNGFKWSPFNMAWQRMLNNAGLAAAEYVLNKVKN